MSEIKYANLQPFDDKIEEMLNNKETQICDFGRECFGLMCEKWWTCNRPKCTRERNDKNET